LRGDGVGDEGIGSQDWIIEANPQCQNGKTAPITGTAFGQWRPASICWTIKEACIIDACGLNGGFSKDGRSSQYRDQVLAEHGVSKNGPVQLFHHVLIGITKAAGTPLRQRYPVQGVR
jgi:hypothetical protein